MRVVVVCVAAGCATVVLSCVVVVVVAAGSLAHELKPSMTAAAVRRINIFIVLDSFVESSVQMPQPDVFLAKFFRRLRHRHFPTQFAGSVNPIDHLH